MTESSSFFKKIVTNNKSSIKLTPSQKEAALPFVTPEHTKEKSKTLSRLFKKIAAKSSTTFNNQKTQYKLTFIPIVKNNETISTTQTEVAEIVWYDNQTISTTTSTTIENSTIETAQRIYDQDTTVYNSLDIVVEWIGNGEKSSNAILQSYMSLFDFQNLKLEQAFRTLCSKLYLKGETQQIDRVLFQFSTRYFQCNPQSIFGSVDVVHAIVYSLLLLNTDLHVAQGDYKRMSQSAFVKNTINTISHNTPADFSCSPFVQSFDCTPLQRVPSNTSDLSTRSSSYTRSFDSGVPRNLSFIFSESKPWEMQIKSMLKQMYSQVRHSQITDPSTLLDPLSRNSSRVGAFKRNVESIIKKKSFCDEDDKTIKSERSSISSQKKEAVTYTTGTPYYKEGSVVIKHLLKSKDLKANRRDWKECYVVIERSQLNIYKRNISNDDSFAQLIESIDLKHTLAHVLPSGYSRQRQHAFTLQQSNGVVHVFQTESAQQVEEWVSTCNYWAARESKEPLVGGISSMEYGWGNCLDNTSSATIHEWNSPSSPIIGSILEESTQLEVFHKHINELTSQLDQHRDIKSRMESHFTGSKFSTRAMTNWKNKFHYLLSEIIKYQNYCISIEKSLSLHASIMA
ncbi:hypothetical protein HPULCUR_008331 [Helicostylum pulchrum]|uniref:Uncharacterized protein n=1 Tax=Helicostylum pulchrum TaxID=562976 RepID=A0ABP9Y7C2_9FUNG